MEKRILFVSYSYTSTGFYGFGYVTIEGGTPPQNKDEIDELINLIKIYDSKVENIVPLNWFFMDSK